MPKATFFNLPEEKKRRIYNAAVREFATRRFSEASLNHIVKSAGIPWGSFYQYFEGKEDLFLYMLNEITMEKRTVLGRTQNGASGHPLESQPEAGVYEVILRTTMATFDWSRASPEYSRISMLMETDDSDFIKELRVKTTAGLREIIENEKKAGLINALTDSDLVVEMIFTLIWKQFALHGHDKETYRQKLQDGMKIIQTGIRADKPNDHRT